MSCVQFAQKPSEVFQPGDFAWWRVVGTSDLGAFCARGRPGTRRAGAGDVPPLYRSGGALVCGARTEAPDRMDPFVAQLVSLSGLMVGRVPALCAGLLFWGLP